MKISKKLLALIIEFIYPKQNKAVIISIFFLEALILDKNTFKLLTSTCKRLIISPPKSELNIADYIS